MSEISKTFSRLRMHREGGLIAYVTAGDPEPASTPRIVEAMIRGGADIIELGVPFSDPIADGPTIQAASVRALKAGTTLKKVFKMVEEIKEGKNAPVVIMTYYNPVFRMEPKNFFESARVCGIDGVIVPDLPIEEAGDYKEAAETYGIDTVFFAAPSTSAERLRRVMEYTSGFLYLISVFGVTGARADVQDFTIRQIEKALPITQGRTPLAVGFGISKPEHIKTIIRNGADAAIVGSGFVRIVQEESNNEEEMLKAVEEYARQLKQATLEKPPS
jgi:tryptophan synthase alpha chain